MTRNKLGFRTNEVISAGLETLDAPAVQTHQHDGADRITGITQSGPGATNVPSYDAAGNLTQLVYSVLGQTFATRYGYDFNNRLVDVKRLRNAPSGSMVTSSVTQLEYDGAGLLLRLTENGNVRRLVRDRIDSLARPIVEIGATTNAVRWYVWSNGKLIAQVESNGTVRIAHADELGKVLALTDNSGVKTDEFAYQPYGRLIAHSGTTDVSFAYMGDYGVWHAGQGLYLTRHRAYESNLARFLQTDPIGLEGGWNLYVYGEENPSVFTDVLGLRSGTGPVRPGITQPFRGLPRTPGTPPEGFLDALYQIDGLGIFTPEGFEGLNVLVEYSGESQKAKTTLPPGANYIVVIDGKIDAPVPAHIGVLVSHNTPTIRGTVPLPSKP